jgi:hypothetical protein
MIIVVCMSFPPYFWVRLIQVQCIDILYWQGSFYGGGITAEFVLLRVLMVVVVKKIREDSVRFDAATLGRSVDEYCAWIMRPNRYATK